MSNVLLGFPFCKLRRLLWLGPALAAVPGLAQSELVGPGQFPQTRMLSALPGGGFGVLATGKPSFAGAMSLSTPIAYSLDNWHFAVILGNTSATMAPRFFSKSEGEFKDSNGTFAAMVGIPTPHGPVTVSAMVISRLLDETTINAQWTPGVRSGPVRFAIGVQDIRSTTETFVPRELESARSLFVVATAQIGGSTYASIGSGTQRFEGIHGNLSAPLGRHGKAIVEYDAYNWNYGLALDLGSFDLSAERRGHGTLFLGYVRGKYATWTIGLTF